MISIDADVPVEVCALLVVEVSVAKNAHANRLKHLKILTACEMLFGSAVEASVEFEAVEGF